MNKKPIDGWPNYWVNGGPRRYSDLEYETGCESLMEKIEDDTFHIGQCYEESPAKVLICKKCKGREFNVGEGSYFTAIRCVNCHWEACVHEG